MEYAEATQRIKALTKQGKYGVLNVTGLLMIAVFIVVAAVLAPVVANPTGGVDIQNNSNFSSASKSVFNLMSLVYIIIIIGIVIGFMGTRD